MPRGLFAALALAAIWPAAATAQADPQRVPRVSITPYLAYRVAHSAQGDVVTSAPDGSVAFAFDDEVTGAAAGGAEIEIRLLRRFTLFGAATFSGAGDNTTTFTGDLNGQATVKGSSFLFARAGVGIHLLGGDPTTRIHHPRAAIMVGPALIREDPAAVDPGAPPELSEAIDHWGVSLGFKGELPIAGRHVVLHFGAEDVVTFWNGDEYARRLDLTLEQEGLLTESTFEMDPSHILVLRLGLAFQF